MNTRRRTYVDFRPQAFPLGRSLSRRVSAAPNGGTHIGSGSDTTNSVMKTGWGVVRVASLRRSANRSGKTPTENESSKALNTLEDSYEEESRRWGEGRPTPQTEAERDSPVQCLQVKRLNWWEMSRSALANGSSRRVIRPHTGI